MTIAYSTAAGTAQSGTDFLPTYGCDHVPGGLEPVAEPSTSPIVGDLQDEPNEAFTLQLTGGLRRRDSGCPRGGRDLDDDGPTIAVDGRGDRRGRGTTPAAVTATLTRKTERPRRRPRRSVSPPRAGPPRPASTSTPLRHGHLPGGHDSAARPRSFPVRGDTATSPWSLHRPFEAQGDETIASPVATVHIQDDDGIDAAAPTEVAPGSVCARDLTPPAAAPATATTT